MERSVLHVFDLLESWMAGQRRGCAFVNAYAELGDAVRAAFGAVR